MQDQEKFQGNGVNSVVVVGRTGKDPEIKYFESGTVKASFSVAVNRMAGKENRETDWFNVDVWGRTAEVVGEYLKKGREVAVNGRLSVRSYTDEAGNEREFLSVTATDVKFLGSKRDSEGGGGFADGGQRAPF
jgi:single-strand DNA-binding protein